MEVGPNHFILCHDESWTWCAAPPRFINLIETPNGWGSSPEEAIAQLLDDPEFQDGVADSVWPIPRRGDFVEVPEPEGAKPVLSYDPVNETLEIEFGSEATGTPLAWHTLKSGIRPKGRS